MQVGRWAGGRMGKQGKGGEFPKRRWRFAARKERSTPQHNATKPSEWARKWAGSYLGRYPGKSKLSWVVPRYLGKYLGRYTRIRQSTHLQFLKPNFP